MVNSYQSAMAIGSSSYDSDEIDESNNNNDDYSNKNDAQHLINDLHDPENHLLSPSNLWSCYYCRCYYSLILDRNDVDMQIFTHRLPIWATSKRSRRKRSQNAKKLIRRSASCERTSGTSVEMTNLGSTVTILNTRTFNLVEKSQYDFII
uniref:Uncharacterized protein n=1 Tax=Romanomermis culicivorax TaxID=13658 RepID=A0A915KI08_ROMCU